MTRGPRTIWPVGIIYDLTRPFPRSVLRLISLDFYQMTENKRVYGYHSGPSVSRNPFGLEFALGEAARRNQEETNEAITN